MVDLSPLSKAIEQGDRDKAVQLTTESLSAGANPQDIITHGLQSGMGVVGEKFSSGEYFLPDMLMAARAMKAAFLGVAYEEIKGSLAFFEKMVNGQWDKDKFIILQPGEEITQMMFLSLLEDNVPPAYEVSHEC
ncbi:hypothetical protein ES703_120075 [subsurface metagenome]